jgi:hypothetical protein
MASKAMIRIPSALTPVRRSATGRLAQGLVVAARTAVATAALIGAASGARADFERFETEVVGSGQNTTFDVYAKFSSPSDKLLLAFHLDKTIGDGFVDGADLASLLSDWAP